MLVSCKIMFVGRVKHIMSHHDYHLLAVAGCDHVHDLLLDVHPAVATELGALPDLGPGVGVGGVSLARAAHHALNNGLFCKICLENMSNFSSLSPCTPL